MRFVLFDIDGTLLLTGGAGSRAMQRTLQEMYGLPGGMNQIRPDGKTDPQIIREVLEREGHAITAAEELFSSLFPRYLGHLKEEIPRSQGFVVLPGVIELLRRLAGEPRFAAGLATGNIEEGAHIKLQQAALSHYFSFGAYGSDSEDRTEVIRIAIQRGLQAVGAQAAEAVFVIGDTPRDIIHGREAGARTVAVASGSYSLQELRVHQPDLALPSLEPIDPVVSFLSA